MSASFITKVFIGFVLFSLVIGLHHYQIGYEILIFAYCITLIELIPLFFMAQTKFLMLIIIFLQYNFYKRTIFFDHLFKLVVIPSLADSLQEISGKFCGKHKIGYVSPNKTYEGYFCGYILLVVINYYIFKFTTLKNISVIFVLGCFGDLYCSYLKRNFKIKDFSNILGPHGGMLDRLNSVIFPMFIHLTIYSLIE